jgi:uncharacterized membrane protein
MSTLTRLEFISRLESKLMVLPENERKNAVNYYSNFIQNAEDESAVIANLGEPSEIAADILASYVKRQSMSAPVPNAPREGDGFSHAPASEAPFEERRERRRRNWWLIILAIFAAPVLISVATGVGGGLIGLFVGLLSAIFAFAVSGVTFLATGAASLFLSVFIFFQDTGFGLLAAGIGFVLVGCGILLLQLTVSIAKWIIGLVKNLIRRLRHGRIKTA